MPDIASGVAKRVAYKKEVSWGVAPGATTAQILRRVTSGVTLNKDTYQSNEVRRDYQIADMRHGVRRVEGPLNGELSCGTYKDFMAAAMRHSWQAAVTTGTISGVIASTGAPHFVRSSGNYLTDGFKAGDLGRWTGWTTTGTNNNSRNMLVTAVTSTGLSGAFLDGTAVAAKGTGDSVVFASVGKKVFVPSTGHLDESFSIEHYHGDLSPVLSELFTGCKLTQMDFGLPPTGMATLGMQFMGRDLVRGTAEYYTTPTAETNTGLLAAVNGALYVQGQAIALITGLNISIAANMSATPVVGSNTYPGIQEGRVVVSGEMSAYFQDATLRDYFVDETEVSLVCALTASGSATADCMSIVMPRIKVGGASKDDGEGGIIQRLPFQALRNTNGGTGISSLDTTISIQDSTVT